jgi:hypothetical protein
MRPTTTRRVWESQSTVHELVGDDELVNDLSSYGIHVVRADVDLPIIDLDEPGAL